MAGFVTRTRFAGHPSRSAKTRHALRLKPDHSIGAAHGDRAGVANDINNPQITACPTVDRGFDAN